jgi:biotin transport system substrate-specific component
MDRVNTKARSITYVALFAALTAVGAFIKIPLPFVPITLQVFFCLLAAILIGPELAVLSQAIYIAVGLCGIPVFTLGGGPAYVLQPTFGYLVGLIAGAFVVGKLTVRLEEPRLAKLFIIALIGVLVIYAIGVPYLYLIKNLYLNKQTSFWKVFYAGFLTTIPGDVLKCYLAALVGSKMLPIMKRSNLL